MGNVSIKTVYVDGGQSKVIVKKVVFTRHIWLKTVNTRANVQASNH